MADEVFGYATDNDRALEYRRKLGSGGFGTVHEVPHFQVMDAYFLLDL